MSPTMSSAGDTASFSDRQFIAITSEKYARVIALPSQNCVYRQQIAVDSDYAVKAEIVSLKGECPLYKLPPKFRKNTVIIQMSWATRNIRQRVSDLLHFDRPTGRLQFAQPSAVNERRLFAAG